MVLHKIIVIIITDQATDGSYCDAQTIDIDLTTGIFLLQQKHQKQTWRQSQTPDTHQATDGFILSQEHQKQTWRQSQTPDIPQATDGFKLSQEHQKHTWRPVSYTHLTLPTTASV